MLFTIYPEVNLCYSQYTLRLTYVIQNIPGTDDTWWLLLHT